MLLATVASLVALAVIAVILGVLLRGYNAKKRSLLSEKGSDLPKINTVDFSSDPSRGRGSEAQATLVHESGLDPLAGRRSRFVALGVLGAAVLGTIAARVGYMQLVNREEYERKARENLYITVSTPAPRGLIFDAAKTPLVQNKSSLTIVADAEVATNRDVVQRLSALLGIPHNIIRQRIMDTSSGAQSQRVVAGGVSLRNVAFILEHPEAFPGVSTQTRSVREYLWGALGAHVLGYTGPISEEALEAPIEGVEHELGDIVGLAGVEASHESILAGSHGKRVVLTDVEGTVREVVSEVEPTKGNDILLTLAAPVQKIADRALAALVAPGGDIGTGKGTAASLVCMDLRDGGIVAMANYPTYTPESFIGGISEEAWALYITDDSHAPLTNRAVEGLYPAASTFKAFTGLAGLNYNFADEKRKWDCQGRWIGFGEAFPQHCWNLSGHGEIDFRGGVVQSCDIVFYEIAKSFYDASDEIGSTAMQEYIKRFGFGMKTGIDLENEAPGRIPTPEWKEEYFRDVPEMAGWQPGDLSNMSIGQGNVLVTPLQLAVAYGAVATGELIRPHVLKEVRNSRGEVVLKREKEVFGIPDVEPAFYTLMRDALHGVAQEDTTVSSGFYERGIDAAAKTGTAEVAGKRDFALFACYAPYTDPKYVVACVVEEGGGGATVASPVSIEVLHAALRWDEGTLEDRPEYIPGSSGKSVPFPDADDANERRLD